MRHLLSTFVGRIVRAAARLRGGGSALPGLVVERFDPQYLPRLMAQLPFGVVAISGTNGKTTTTKMVVELLSAQGLKVFTNKTGSNFARGIVAAALGEVNWKGELKADIAVLELDEAHAMHVIDRVRPRHTLLLNVLRDQLDRFGELDYTASLLKKLADATQDTVVVNCEDPLLHEIGVQLSAAGRVRVLEFGLSESLRELFPNDQELYGAATETAVKAGHKQPDVMLTAVGEQRAKYLIDGAEFETTLRLEGLYNLFNAAAAMTLVRAILAHNATPVASDKLLHDLAEIRPAFGRGEQLELDGEKLELVLVKNPAGFRLGLASFAPENVAVMIAINDQYADGRDMSWLWDVDFSTLQAGGVDTVSGVRAWDMTLRLQHDEVAVGQTIEDLRTAVASFRERTAGVPRRIYCSYTAMLEIRKYLAELTDVEDVW
ncbi:Mur ligase family protein [Canibacter zhoujuaniae]|uniref:Mur ligase family protein n=1 Tax=Canibacter zhoujuaniae TaxID=2708343 RepID=UPI00141FFA0F|nr:Mur ligase family protein [Canibacter zhoujuaniae]